MKWYLGGYDFASSPHSTEKLYSAERGNKPASSEESIITWDGYVGLMYPSDYGYTYANGVDSKCYDNENSCDSGTPANGWLFNSRYQWTLTPHSPSTYQALNVNSDGNVTSNVAWNEYGVRPVVYLKSSVNITGGTGQESNPYTIEEKTSSNLDMTAPICTIESITPDSPTTEDSVQIKINCTDNSGTVIEKSPIIKEDIEIKLNGDTTNVTKELSTSSPIESGIQYTLTLNEFEKGGSLSINIPANKIFDESGNSNRETSLTMGTISTVYEATTEQFVSDNTASGSSYTQGNADSHKMFSDLGGGSRYIGDVPYNYVKIDGESSLWRIIGVFNDPVASGEQSGKKIKLIRDESIGNYSWDNTTETLYGSNNWSKATLQQILNSGAYWKKENGTCSTGKTLGETKTCDFSNTGLSSNLKGMIAKMKWYLGGYNWSGTPSAQAFYSAERGSAVPSGASSTWEGFVGLMYPSDYGFTYANGVDDTCFNDESICNSGKPSNGWLFNNDYQWTLTPYPGRTNDLFSIYSDGRVYNSNYWAYNELIVRPVVYLKSTINITGGSGQKNDPYTIG